MSLKVLLSTLTYSMSFSFAHGKITVTLTGDPHDETLLMKKQELEAQGLAVRLDEINHMSITPVDAEHPFVSLHRGTMLKQFRMRDIDGNVVDSAEYSGRLIHICIWSVHNQSCIEEFRELNELKAKYQDEDAVFLAITPDTASEVKKVLENNPLDYLVIPGALKFCEDLGVDGYPKHLFIDREGMIVDVTEGSNYTGGVENDEVVMLPNNFPVYDKAMRHLTEFGVFSAD